MDTSVLKNPNCTLNMTEKPKKKIGLDKIFFRTKINNLKAFYFMEKCIFNLSKNLL